MQSSHAVEPSSSWNLPASHSVHESAPLPENLPGAHELHEDALSFDHVPPSHLVHALLDSSE